MSRLPEPVDAFIRRYLLAVQQGTRIPVTGVVAGWIGNGPGLMRTSAPHLPGVGWLVGMAACLAFAVLSITLPPAPLAPLAAAAGCCLVTALLTGAMHEAGLARHLDAATAGSRAGTVALVLTLAAKMALLAVLGARSPGAVLTALLAAHTVSRLGPLVLVRTLPPVADAATANLRPWTDRVDWRALAVGAAWCVLPLALMALAHGTGFAAMGLAAAALAIAAMRWRLLRHGRGFDADALGAAQQAAELAFYLGCALGLSPR